MKDHSPQAFPCPTGSDGGVFQVGMTLRDYFAAAALQGLTSSPGNWWWKHEDGTKQHLVLTSEYCQFAYEMADAMLAEREKP